MPIFGVVSIGILLNPLVDIGLVFVVYGLLSRSMILVGRSNRMRLNEGVVNQFSSEKSEGETRTSPK